MGYCPDTHRKIKLTNRKSKQKSYGTIGLLFTKQLEILCLFCKSEVTGKHQSANKSKVCKWERASSARLDVKWWGSSESEQKSIKQSAAIIHASQNSEQNSDASRRKNDEITQTADQPIKTPICCSIDQIEVLQTLGIFTFAAQYETHEFLQKIIQLINKLDRTK